VGLRAKKDRFALKLRQRNLTQEKNTLNRPLAADGHLRQKKIVVKVPSVLDTGCSTHVQLSGLYSGVQIRRRTGGKDKVVGHITMIQGIVDGQDIEIANFPHANGFSGS
jgi:hypothetical protein